MARKRNKFKKGFVAEYNQHKQHEQEAEKLRKKHNITNDNVIVVEKSNTVKFILRIGFLTLKTIAWLLLVCLATIGIVCLIYPETRVALLDILFRIFSGTIDLIQS